MKYYKFIIYLGFTLLFIIFNSCNSNRSDKNVAINIIPIPSKIEIGKGPYILQADTKILVEEDNKEALEIAKNFVDRFNLVSGFNISIEKTKEDKKVKGAILFTSKNIVEDLGDEGYTLNVDSSSIVVKALKPDGLFYGVQSLLQLLPTEIYGNQKLNKSLRWSIPAVKIVDKPRFGWRGMHLDVSRHFFSKEAVKKYIDMLAMHKMNTFHWHLVDDQGWRIEIKKYPKLIEIGSNRADLPWNDWEGKEKDDTPVYGGYYTQEDVKEVVAYAQDRFITILPEIEMPGHTLASLAAYPEISCTGGPFTVPSGGVDIMSNHTYCPGNDKTFEFLEGVLTEIIDLFPSKYIHIGGDETTRERWKNCVKCQTRIKEEGLENEDELYAYFINRIENILNAKGKTLMGWDEILEGGDELKGTVMSWRGVDRTVKAVHRGLDVVLSHRGLDVVLSPSSYLYFGDYEEEGELQTPLEKVYSFEPVPPELNKEEEKHILGAQGSVWTEVVTSPKQIEKIVLPQMTALAELTWSTKENKNFESFLKRLAHQYDRFDAMKLNYRQPDLQGGFNGKHVFTDSTLVKIISPRLNTKVHFTLDGSDPSLQSSLYTNPFYLKSNTVLKAREFLSDGGKGRIRKGIYIKQELMASVKVDNIQPGLLYQYIEGKYMNTSEIPTNQFIKNGVLASFVFPPKHRKLYFASIYSGIIQLPVDGIYTFYCETNDGSQLYISDKLVVDHGGLHPAEEKSGSIALQASYHPIKVIYFQNAGSSFLKISYKGPKTEKQEIPASVLFH